MKKLKNFGMNQRQQRRFALMAIPVLVLMAEGFYNQGQMLFMMAAVIILIFIYVKLFDND